MKLVLSALVALAFVAGCAGAAAAPQTNPTSAPTPTLAPTPTDEPLIDPVTEEAPEEEPAPEPDSGADEWLAYSLHNVEAMPTFIDYSQSFIDELDVLDSDGAISVMQDWDEWLIGEIDWLKDNPPHKCYAKHHERLLKVYKLERKAVKSYTSWLYAFPYGEDRDFNRGMKATKDATRELERNNKGFDKFDAACTA